MRLDHIEVVVPHSPLERELWEFWLRVDHSTRLILDGYRRETRENTRKRNWDAHKVYTRIGDKRRLRADVKMEADDVPLPDAVVAAAKSQICDAINAMEVERNL